MCHLFKALAEYAACRVSVRRKYLKACAVLKRARQQLCLTALRRDSKLRRRGRLSRAHAGNTRLRFVLHAWLTSAKYFVHERRMWQASVALYVGHITPQVFLTWKGFALQRCHAQRAAQKVQGTLQFRCKHSSLAHWLARATWQSHERQLLPTVLVFWASHVLQKCFRAWNLCLETLRQRRTSAAMRGWIKDFQWEDRAKQYSFASWHDVARRRAQTRHLITTSIASRTTKVGLEAIGFWHASSHRRLRFTRVASRLQNSQKRSLKKCSFLAWLSAKAWRRLKQQASRLGEVWLERAAWRTWGSLVMWRRWAETAMSSARQRHCHRSLRHSMQVLQVVVEWRQFKLQVTARGVSRRADVLAPLTLQTWRTWTSWTRRKRKIIKSGLQQQRLRLMSCSIHGFMGMVAWRRVKRRSMQVGAITRVECLRQTAWGGWCNYVAVQRLNMHAVIKKLLRCAQILLRHSLEVLTAFVLWRRLKRWVIGKVHEHHASALKQIAWQSLVSHVSWQRQVTEVIATTRRRQAGSLLRCTLRSLSVFAAWSKLKHSVTQEGLAKTASILQCEAMSQWHAYVACRGRKKAMGTLGAALRGRSLLCRSVTGLRVFRDWRRRCSAGVWHRNVLLQCRASRKWRAYSQHLRCNRAAAHAVKKWQSHVLARTSIQGWLDVAGCQQRERRLMQAAIGLRTRSLQLRTIHLWRSVVTWVHWARQLTRDALLHRLQHNASDALQVWVAFVAQEWQRKQLSQEALTRWSQCWISSKRIVTLRSWRRNTALRQWRGLAVQEAVWQKKHLSQTRSILLWHQWAPRHREQRRVAALARQQLRALNVHSVLAHWSVSIKLQAAIRQAMCKAKRHRRRYALGCSVRALVTFVTWRKLKRTAMDLRRRRRLVFMRGVFGLLLASIRSQTATRKVICLANQRRIRYFFCCSLLAFATFAAWCRLKRSAVELGGRRRSASTRRLLEQWSSIARSRAARLQVILQAHQSRIQYRSSCCFRALVAFAAWRRLKRSAVEPGRRWRRTQNSLASSVRALLAFTAWRKLKRTAVKLGRRRRSDSLNSLAWKCWQASVAWKRKKHQAFNFGVQKKVLHLLRCSITGLLVFRAWKKRIRAADQQKRSLLWSRATREWCIRTKQLRRRRHLSLAASKLQASSLQGRMACLWRAVVVRVRWAEKILCRHLREQAERTMLDAQLVWLAFVVQTRQRRQAASATMLRWARCRAASMQQLALQSWHLTATRQRFKELMVQQAVRRLEQMATRQMFSCWIIRAQTNKQQRLAIARIEAHLHKESNRCVWGVWISHLHRRRIGAILRDRWSKSRRAQGLASLGQNVVAKRAHRVLEVKALFWCGQQVTSAALNLWRCYMKARQSKHVLRVSALNFHIRSLSEIALWTWRLNAFEARAVRRSDAVARKLCFSSWCLWTRSRIALRQQVIVAQVRVRTLCGIRKWARWRKSLMKKNIMRLSARAFDTDSSLCTAFGVWRRTHSAALVERINLAMRAAWLQWRHYVRNFKAGRFAMKCALAQAAAHDQHRLKLMVARSWSGRVAWTAANLEANFQLVHKRRQAQRKQDWLRRRSVGPNEEELRVMELSLCEWHAFRTAQMQTRHRVRQACTRHNNCALLLVLDQWVDVSLPPDRAENLRRRRHVRFTPELISRKRVASGHRPNKAIVRAVASGGVGQWALKTGTWEASVALTDALGHECTIEPHIGMPSPTSCPPPKAIDSVAVQAGDLATATCQWSLADTGSTISPAAIVKRYAADEILANIQPQLPELPRVVPDYTSLGSSKTHGSQFQPPARYVERPSPLEVHDSSQLAVESRRARDAERPSPLEVLGSSQLALESRMSSNPSVDATVAVNAPQRSIPSAADGARKQKNNIMQFFKLRGGAGA